MIGRCLVLSSGLGAVASVAERLPVGLIPEQSPVSTVRDNVVHISGLDVATFLQALHAQGMRKKESLSRLLPCRTVAQLCRRTILLRVKRFVLVAVLRSGGNQCCTAGMLAGNPGLGGH